MLVDPYPSQQHAGLQHAVFHLQLEVTRRKARLNLLWLRSPLVDGWGIRWQHILVRTQDAQFCKCLSSKKWTPTIGIMKAEQSRWKDQQKFREKSLKLLSLSLFSSKLFTSFLVAVILRLAFCSARFNHSEIRVSFYIKKLGIWAQAKCCKYYNKKQWHKKYFSITIIFWNKAL